jgi:hypothetical protein
VNWHVSDQAMVSWVDGTTDAVSGASVEQHLVHCDSYRRRVRLTVDDRRPASVPDLEALWSSIADVAQLPRQTWFERLLMSFRPRHPTPGLSLRRPRCASPGSSARSPYSCS